MNRCSRPILTVSLVLFAAALVAVPAQAADTGTAVRHDTSPPLSEMARIVPKTTFQPREIPIHVPFDLAGRHHGDVPGGDALRPTVPDPSTTATPAPLLSFPGLTDDDNAAIAGGRIVPPDTQGDVGQQFYVQWINLIWAVYDKTTGAIAPGGGPFPGNVVWQGFGGICETNNDGDPIVLYDHLADRWMFSQFAIGSEGHQCVAVSTTNDPRGPWHRYDFVISPGAGGFNDYPKMGVWPDGYYLSANQFNNPGFEGAIAVAFERSQMLTGGAAQFVKFGPLACGTTCFFSIQPSHLEGPAPAPGAPNPYVMAFDDQTWGAGTGADGYRMWNFAVNWTTPASSTFTALPQINTTGFDAELCAFNACVPQPSPGELLDTLSQFTMYRAQYRNFGSHASIVVNHTVDLGGDLAGIRWAELRNTGGGWTLNQTGTFAPADGVHRWMGSAAQDSAGNIALGYSASSTSLYPSVRYAQVAPTLGSEVVLQAGAGAQSASFNRWGDYSSMSIDPVDDCTFWFTTEYYANDGNFDFATRIGSFKFPNCAAAVCGNNVREGGEACDGSDLGGQTCGDFGCGGGTLACNAGCDGFDTSGCTSCSACDNDGTCEVGEDCNNCPNDCVSGTTGGAVCGNGICEAGNGEDCLSCAADCNGKQSGKPASRFCCGDGDGQNPVSCGDSRCTAGSFACTTVPALPGTFCCGDAVCDTGEGCNNCSLDCASASFETSCTDGVDNDCDGAIDCADSDCAGNAACQSCTLGQPGASCTANSQCCSNKCKGKPGAMTCA